MASQQETKSTESKGLSVTFSGVSYSVPLKKKQTLTILDHVSGAFKPGEMSALMGPSGSGKTTLMDVLASRKTGGKIEGEVLYSGLKPSRSTLRHLCGYVEQFDTLIGELTVEQMLMYTAELKLPISLGAAAKKERVEEVLLQLNLESCKDTVIGNALQRGISGGQAKRVNIALALITRPSVIFLDEPTSGLDSTMANEVALCLRSLASEGRTVVCTIHSPTSYAFSLFDSLFMLNAGKVIYGGPVAESRAYFESCGLSFPDGYSLPEWLVDITSSRPSVALAAKSSTRGVSVEGVDPEAALHEASTQRDFAAAYAASPLFEAGEASRLELNEYYKAAGLPPAPAPPGALKALATLLRYRTLTHYRSGEFLGPRIGDKVIFGVLILSLYWKIGQGTDAQSIQSTAALLYFIAALCGYGAAAFVPSLTLDRPLFYRELADGCYSPLIYYLAKFIEEAFLCTFTSLIFGLLVYFGCALQGSFLVFVLSYYLTTMTGICLAYAVAAAVPTMEAANALLPTYVTTCMYFGGLFMLFDKIPAGWYWFSWTSFLRYSWGAMMNNNFIGTDPGEAPAFWDDDAQRAIPVLEFYGMEGAVMGSIGACIGLLAALTFIFACMGAAALTFIRHGAR